MHHKQRDAEFGGASPGFARQILSVATAFATRIVTKVLLFVVPRVVLIAGLGDDRTVSRT
ncbi:hypothetical protein [Rhizobium mongolense]|uniref:hypothetical protein n=1 Tax=Rhizobium mongolense TaxID=57676 RepID=UPI001113FB0F|nr:hypothetical protein [Rhizobium mongolense]